MCYILSCKRVFPRDLHNDVVDGDVNELHKEPDKTHHSKPYCCCQGDALELCMREDVTD